MLTAGIARVDITPPVPIDLVGYSRRAEPARHIRAPLTATALALGSGPTTAVVVAADVPFLLPAHADRLRTEIGDALGTPADHVMISVSHTHGGPTTHTHGVKIGGRQRERSANERVFIDSFPGHLVTAAIQAAGNMEPVMAAGGVGTVDLAVNRREKNAEGRVILGWNPDKPVDRDVGVLRLDRLDGTTMAVVANYACHPVVVGPEDPGVNPDFPGAMRDVVEQVTGATCLFLQGGCGNLLPLQGFFDHPGPEKAFGRKLAVEVLHVLEQIDPIARRMERIDYGSVTPIVLHRQVAIEPQPEQALAAVGKVVDLPLKPLPSLADLEAGRDGYQRELDEARLAGADQVALNPIEYHLNWAEDAISQLQQGEAATKVPAFLQALRIGDTVIATMPGEAFSELSIEVKERSAATTTLFSAYTNGVLTYMPPASEYPDGGYECDYAHHSYGLIEQIAPESERILVETSVELISATW
ncbi:MAG: hypothetical protein OXI29_15940 [bacterium]|nr:hypothetical protein [bacterium]